MRQLLTSGLIRKSLVYGSVIELLSLVILYLGGGIGHSGPNSLLGLIPFLLNIPGFLVLVMLAEILPMLFCYLIAFSAQVVVCACIALLFLGWGKSVKLGTKQ